MDDCKYILIFQDRGYITESRRVPHISKFGIVGVKCFTLLIPLVDFLDRFHIPREALKFQRG